MANLKRKFRDELRSAAFGYNIDSTHLLLINFNKTTHYERIMRICFKTLKKLML